MYLYFKETVPWVKTALNSGQCRKEYQNIFGNVKRTG